MRFARIVATCSSVSLYVCQATVRCLPRGVPACFCHPVQPLAPRERSRTSRAQVVGAPACFRCQSFQSASFFAAESSVGRERDGCYSWFVALVCLILRCLGWRCRDATTNGNIGNCWRDVGHLIAASSVASVHFRTSHVKSSGSALSRSTCAPVLRSSPPRVVWLGVPLLVDRVFCGILMQPVLACVSCSPVCVGHEGAVWFRRFLGHPLPAIVLFLPRCFASIFQLLRFVQGCA